MVNSKLYDNIAIYILALQAVVFYSDKISLAKLFLVAPFVKHKLLLQYLCREEKINSLEGLISKKPNYFSTFHKRYENGLIQSMNAIQYMLEMRYISIENGVVYKEKNIGYEDIMGKQAKMIFDAAKNISSLLNTNDEEKLYLNLRIKL
jgi:hypothetical protein